MKQKRKKHRLALVGNKDMVNYGTEASKKPLPSLCKLIG